MHSNSISAIKMLERINVRSLLLIFLIVIINFYTITFKLIAVDIPTSPPPSSKILFVDNSESPKTYIAMINADGSQKVRLTGAFNNAVFPKYCKAKGLIAFTNHTPEMRSEVYLMNKDGSNLRKILDNACFEAFSPDGKFLLYTTADSNAMLYSYNLETGRSVMLVPDLKITSADWSMNKEWIAASALSDDGTNDLYLISTMAQGIVRLTNTPKIDESFPIFTSDSNYLVFLTNRHSMPEIEYFDIQRKNIQRPLIVGMYPSISHDKLWVVFEFKNYICVSRFDGLHSKQITNGINPHWME